MPGPEETEEFNRTVLTNATELQVSNLNGAVSIQGWDREEVFIHAVKSTVYGRAELDKVVLTVSTDDVIAVRTSPTAQPSLVSVQYDISIPRRFSRLIVSSTNGGLSLRSVNGTTSLDTSNGPIQVQGLTGDLTAHTSNGAVTVRDVTGAVRAYTSNGGLVVENVGVLVSAETSNGAIRADVLSAPLPVRIATTNGNIAVRLSPALGATLDCRTSNGRIVFTGIPLEVQESSPTALTGSIGGGGNPITITTSNADITLSLL